MGASSLRKSNRLSQKENKEKKPTKIQDQKFEPTVKVVGNLFKCHVCKYVTKDRSHSIRHYCLHTTKAFKCSKCEYESDDRKKFEYHLDIHGLKLLTCSECCYETGEEDCFAIHQKGHSTSSYNCSQCTNRPTRLKAQDESDETPIKENVEEFFESSNTKQFKCPECAFQTRYNSNLKVHFARRHSGMKRFSCSFCDYGTYFRNRLKNHMLTHVEARANNLKKRRKMHEKLPGLNKCPKCSFQTSFKGNLKRHLLCHSKSKLYKCPNCSFKTNYNFVLNRHKKFCGVKNIKEEERVLTHSSVERECSTNDSDCDYFASGMGLKNHLKINEGINGYHSTLIQQQHTKLQNEVHVDNIKEEERGLTHSSVERECSTNDSDCDYFASGMGLKNHLKINEGINGYHSTLIQQQHTKLQNEVHVDNISFNSKPIMCSVGDFETSYNNDVTVHNSNNHSGNKLFRCSVCSFQTDLESRYKKHISTHARGVKTYLDTLVFKCSECNFKSSTKRNLNLHVKSHLCKKSFQCFDCSFETSSDHRYQKHLKSHTRGKSLTSTRRENLTSEVHKCSECTFTTHIKGNLTRHFITHSNSKLYNCENCNFETNYMFVLKKHNCGFTVNYTKSEINYHLTISEDGLETITSGDNKFFKCPVCRYISICSFNVKVHYDKKHSNVSLLCCSECNFKTYSSSLLKKHLSNHNKNRSNRSDISSDNDSLFKCSECDFKTRIKGNLTRHLRSHSKSKLFRCLKCNFGTNYKYVLERHEKRHLESSDNLFKCSECDFETISKAVYNDHELSHKKYITEVGSHENVEHIQEIFAHKNFEQEIKSGIKIENITSLADINDECDEAELEDIKPICEVILENIKEEDVTLESVGYFHELTALENDGRDETEVGNVDPILVQPPDANERNPESLIIENGEMIDEYSCSHCQFKTRHFDMLTSHLSSIHNKLNQLQFNYGIKTEINEDLFAQISNGNEIQFREIKEKVEHNSAASDFETCEDDKNLFLDYTEHSYELSFNKF